MNSNSLTHGWLEEKNMLKMIQSSIRRERKVFTVPRKARRHGNTRSSSRAVDAFEGNKAAEKSGIFFSFLFFFWRLQEHFSSPLKTINSKRILLKETETSNCVKTFHCRRKRQGKADPSERHCVLCGAQRPVLEE